MMKKMISFLLQNLFNKFHLKLKILINIKKHLIYYLLMKMKLKQLQKMNKSKTKKNNLITILKKLGIIKRLFKNNNNNRKNHFFQISFKKNRSIKILKSKQQQFK